MGNGFIEEPLVSIIVPCYNHEPYVIQCIESIIDQDYKNIELIVVDDGSVDGSAAKIKSIAADCERRFVRFEFVCRPNKGLCATLNEAIDWCEGELISFIASDDMLVKDKASFQVKYLSSNSDVVAVFGGLLIVDERGETLTVSRRVEGKFSFNDVLLNKACLKAPTMMVRAAELKEICPLPTDILIEDRYIQLALTKGGMKLSSINKQFAKYRRHESNTSNKVIEIFNDNVRLIEQFSQGRLREKAIARNMLGCAVSLCGSDRKKAKLYFEKSLRRDVSIFFWYKAYYYFLKVFLNVR